MTEDTFKEAEYLRKKISHYEKKIKDSNNFLKYENTIAFTNMSSMDKVELFEDKNLINYTLKTAINIFHIELNKAKQELEQL